MSDRQKLLDELRSRVPELQHSFRLSGSVKANFGRLHRELLEWAAAETMFEPPSENWMKIDRTGKLRDTKKPLPPKRIRTDLLDAIDTLTVLVALIPRMETAERNSKAAEIITAIDRLQVVLSSPKIDKEIALGIALARNPEKTFTEIFREVKPAYANAKTFENAIRDAAEAAGITLPVRKRGRRPGNSTSI